jgi:hypothetical protein
MTKIIRRIRGLCLANIISLSSERVYCERKAHAIGTPHRSGNMSWSSVPPRNGITVIKHDS